MGTAEVPVTCPHCGRTNEFHDGDHPANVPTDGDAAICWKCRGLAIYVNGPLGIALRAPTDDERQELLADAGVRAALGAIRESYSPDQAVRLWRGDTDG